MLSLRRAALVPIIAIEQWLRETKIGLPAGETKSSTLCCPHSQRFECYISRCFPRWLVRLIMYLLRCGLSVDRMLDVSVREAGAQAPRIHQFRDCAQHPNSGPQACTARALTTEPSIYPDPRVLILKINVSTFKYWLPPLISLWHKTMGFDF